MYKRATVDNVDFHKDYVEELGDKAIKNKKFFKRVVGEYCREMAKDFLSRGLITLPARLGQIKLYKFTDESEELPEYHHRTKLRPVWIRGKIKNGHCLRYSITLYRKMYKRYEYLLPRALEKKRRNDLQN